MSGCSTDILKPEVCRVSFTGTTTLLPSTTHICAGNRCVPESKYCLLDTIEDYRDPLLCWSILAEETDFSSHENKGFFDKFVCQARHQKRHQNGEMHDPVACVIGQVDVE